jgi:hypothetical protein
MPHSPGHHIKGDQIMLKGKTAPVTGSTPIDTNGRVMAHDHLTRAASATLARIAQRPLAVFLVMGLSFTLGSLLSLDLVSLAYSNASFVLEYGVMALKDGGLLQSLHLLGMGYLALACYVVFKCCEKQLVEILLHGPTPDEAAQPDAECRFEPTGAPPCSDAAPPGGPQEAPRRSEAVSQDRP